MSFEQASTDFLAWLEALKVEISPKIALQDLRAQNQGRGLVALEDIKQDEVLYTIPRSACLNVDNCTLIRDHPHLKEKLLEYSHWDGLIIAILYEIRVAGASSAWKPYFDVLPIRDESYVFNQLMFWSDDELKDLHPSLTIDRIGKDLAEAMYAKLHPKEVVETLGLTQLAEFSLEEYHKIALLIMSYSFDMDRPDKVDDDESDDESLDEAGIANDTYFKTMIPLADTLNADTTLHNASLTYTANDLVMKSVCDIKKGDQIYNMYADHPNSEILRRYGYVEITGSKHDFGEVPLPLIKKFFVDTGAISAEFIDEVLEIVNTIVHEDEDDELVEIVLDSYDCFRSGEIITELIFILQILTVVVSINLLKSMEDLLHESKVALISRIFKKTYQLIEGRKLTKLFLSNYKKIIELRMAEYPKVSAEPFDANLTHTLDRKQMAHVVLKSEYQSLQACLDTDRVFTTEDGKYAFIEDDKLIKNIVKKKFFDETPSPEATEPVAKKRKT